jgi:hypothetical protein
MSFEPGEDWFFDYEKQRMVNGGELLPPHSHPEDQPAPGPAGRVPANWESLLHSLALIISSSDRCERWQTENEQGPHGGFRDGVLAITVTIKQIGNAH